MSSEYTSAAEEDAKFFEDQRCLHDLIKGFSECNPSLLDEQDKTPPYFIKHLTMLDHGGIAIKNKEYEEMGKRKGLKKEKEIIKILIDTNNWSVESEKQYENLNIQAIHLEKTKTQIFLDSQRNIIKKRLEETHNQLEDLEKKRESLIGLTLEQFVTNRTNTYSLWQSMYKDVNLSDRVYSTFEEFYSLSCDDIEIYHLLFAFKIGFFNESRLKRVAVSGAFMNSYMLTKGMPLEFFGKTAVQLTTFQLSALNYAGGFLNTLENAERNIPNLTDPDEVVKWLEDERDRLTLKYKPETALNAPERRTSSDSEFQAISAPTATKEEVGVLATRENAGVIDLHTAAEKLKKKLGKDTLDTYDMAKLHGLM